MFKDKLNRVSFALAAIVATSAAAVGFAQSDDAASAKPNKRPLSVRSIRPLQRSETPANQAPNLDKSSDEFSYFRDELGRAETSTKTKKRLQELESRVVYADPMDKPAWDGSPFVDVYADVFVDDTPFYDPEDPDEMYRQDEENILAVAIDLFSTTSKSITALTGIGATTGSANGQNGNSSMMNEPLMPMPDAGDGKIMVSVGPMPGGGPGGPAESVKKDESTKSGPSAKDDTKLIFPEDAENPFKAEAQPIDEAFDFFKADREFKATASMSKNGGDKGGMSGMPDMGSAYPDDVTFGK